MILYSKPQKATFPMRKKSRPTAQKGQSKSRESKKKKIKHHPPEAPIKKWRSCHKKKEADRACHYTYYYYTKQKPKSGIKKA
jgi:hypothetical protein